ncbi:MAG: cryptochrome/photolyase family protein [Actinomycetota bacterium]|nr:cryptochrome/photolyase family protein [Actinomycetota bacterium]
MRLTGVVTRRWLFGDQLGPHFLDDHDQPVLMIESREVFARRRFHRAKAHLVLSAMRHRAAELGEQCVYVRAANYTVALDRIGEPLSVCHPTSRSALTFVLGHGDIDILPARGFATSADDFARWVQSRGRRRLLMEDFYRDSRRRLRVLMDGEEPVGGRWNFDADNREPPPRSSSLGVAEPAWPVEDEIDQEVRDDLDRWQRDGHVRFLGVDGPRRFGVTRDEALAILDRFITHRLPKFGPHEDAMLSGDPWMAHSMLSAPMNLGLLEPVEVVARAEGAYRRGEAPLGSVEGFIRQVLGWRDFVWHLYWHLPASYRDLNELRATEPLPDWFAELDAGSVDAACLSGILADVRDHGWVHHIPRLMVLGNYAMQRGWDPAQVTDWFHRAFVDGYDWVMVPNVVGMSQYADGGILATKPYAAGGAYINRMGDYCRGCRYDPRTRVGDDACPFTAGYWSFLHRNRELLAGNARLAQPLSGLARLNDLEEVLAQESARGSSAP